MQYFSALEIVLRSIYTGELDIKYDLFPDIVDVASYLQYEQVLNPINVIF